MSSSLKDLPLGDCEHVIGSETVLLKISPEQMELTREHLQCWAESNSASIVSHSLNLTARGDIEMESAALKRDIEGLLDEMRLLHSKLQVKEIQIRKNDSVLSPIRNIPPELLRQILSEIDPPMLPDEAFVLHRIMLVNRLWRRIVESIPQLWSRLRLGNEPKCLRYVTRMLERKTSYSSHLTGSITCGATSISDAIPKLLLSSMHLWGGLTIDIGNLKRSSTGSLVSTLKALSGSSSLLELNFKKIQHCGRHIAFPTTPFDAFELPSVRNLVIEFLYPMTLPPVRLPQLRNITGVAMSLTVSQLEELARVAKTAKRLTFLKIIDRERNTLAEWVTALMNPPEFPNVLELTLPLDDYAPSIYESFSIGRLTVIAGCRSLVSLHASLFYIPAEAYLPEISTLGRLTLHITEIVALTSLKTIDRWADWMCMMPHVTTLHVQINGGERNKDYHALACARRVIYNLRVDDDSPDLLPCPALTSLVYEKLHFGKFLEEDLKGLEDFAHSYSRRAEDLGSDDVQTQVLLNHARHSEKAKSRPCCSVTILDHGKLVLRNAYWKEFNGWINMQEFEKSS